MLHKLHFALLFGLLVSCSSPATPVSSPSQATPRVLAVESFLADISQQVAGDRLVVESLLPLGMDPHTYQPAPRDILRVAKADVLVLNGGGIESFVESLLSNAGNHPLQVIASQGLDPRPDPTGEHPEGDPHFWLDPNQVVAYVENIRLGLVQADPQGFQDYNANAEAYIKDLQELDAWIASQVATIPPSRRVLVTNHETLGYFADRYGFSVIGSIIPGVSSDASPSARQLVDLVDRIRASHASVVFMETGANLALARQLADETGILIVSDLYTHSLSGIDGPASTYLEMMKYNVTQIVKALE